MNYWTQLSVDFANQRNYLDELFRVYPTIPNGIRKIEKNKWDQIEKFFHKKDQVNLLRALLDLELFPIKDSYVAYLKRDPKAINRNPATVQRLVGRIYGMGLDEIWEKCTEPKETNRQIGPLFRRWLNTGELGAPLEDQTTFLSHNRNAILSCGDSELAQFAKNHLGYVHTKGLDFIARFNGKYIIGEAKFLTDFGGHQNAQFQDALATINHPTGKNTIAIAILDGVLYVPGNNLLYKYIKNNTHQFIMSALVLREYLYSI